MDTSDINDIARAYEESLLGQKMTKAELIMLLALINARISIKIYGPSEQHEPSIKTRPRKTVTLVKTAKKPAAPVRPAKPAKPIKKSVAYDPLYDPAPPMSGDPVPPRPEITLGKIIIAKNTAAICDSCRKVIYISNRDITEGMSYDDFAVGFTPTDPGIEPIGDNIEIQNIDGNISVDCPSCKGVKCLYLVGRKQ